MSNLLETENLGCLNCGEPDHVDCVVLGGGEPAPRMAPIMRIPSRTPWTPLTAPLNALDTINGVLDGATAREPGQESNGG